MGGSVLASLLVCVLTHGGAVAAQTAGTRQAPPPPTASSGAALRLPTGSLDPVSLALSVGSVLAAPRPQSTNVSSLSFDDFMRLNAQNRRERFGQLDATNKAMLVRTHAERWLATNRGRVGASEQAFIEEAITLVTPESFNPPVDAKTEQRQDEFKDRYRCRVNPAYVSAAFDVLGFRGMPSLKYERWTYLSQAKCWIPWFTEAAIDFLPSTPPPKR